MPTGFEIINNMAGARDDLLKIPIKNTKFICVEYPGIVKNVAKMLDTLGGSRSISRVVADQSRRLDLKWRPDDCFCKPAYADRFSTNGLVLRVRRKKTQGAEQEEKLDAEVIGVVETTFRFEALADYQYLPMTRNKDNKYDSLRDHLVINKLEHSSWIQKPAPLFLVPTIFSRIDQSVLYMYRPDKSFSQAKQPNLPKNDPSAIGLGRSRRPHYTKLLKFDDETPDAPTPEAEKYLRPKLKKDGDKLEELKNLFEEQPVWSRSHLRSRINILPSKLKMCLPLIAYYFVTGPWRSMWVRHGYDPRKHPEAKHYQTLDFRIRQRTAGDRIKVKCKRSTFTYNLPSSVQKRNLSRTSLIEREHLDKTVPQKQLAVSEKMPAYVFKPGMIPPYRQMFYQICDVLVPEIQELVNSNDGKETVCTERDGWLKLDGVHYAREILSKHVDSIRDVELPYVDLERGNQKKPPSERKKKLTLAGTGLSDSESEGELEDPEQEINEMEAELLDFVDEVVEEGAEESMDDDT